jgi:hypothetical protein
LDLPARSADSPMRTFASLVPPLPPGLPPLPRQSSPQLLRGGRGRRWHQEEAPRPYTRYSGSAGAVRWDGTRESAGSALRVSHPSSAAAVGSISPQQLGGPRSQVATEERDVEVSGLARPFSSVPFRCPGSEWAAAGGGCCGGCGRLQAAAGSAACSPSPAAVLVDRQAGSMAACRQRTQLFCLWSVCH